MILTQSMDGHGSPADEPNSDPGSPAASRAAVRLIRLEPTSRAEPSARSARLVLITDARLVIAGLATVLTSGTLKEKQQQAVNDFHAAVTRCLDYVVMAAVHAEREHAQ
jgi:hypothetical protein